MSQDVCSLLPFQALANPDAERARERHLEWVVGHGLARGAAALRRYRALRLADLASSAHPEAAGDDLDLVTDAVCVAFTLGDQYGDPRVTQPERITRITTELAAIAYRLPGAPPELDLPLTRAHADVWRRCAAGMSPAWRARAAGSLTRFLRARLQEAHNRALGVRPREDAYLGLRGHAVGAAPCFDLIERAGRFEVPPAAYWSRELRALTRHAGDVVLLCDDVHAAERAEAAGDPHNLVLIRQRERGCTRAEATGQVVDLARERVEAFRTVAAAVPGLLGAWRLDARGVAAVERYLAGLRAWMVANQLWGAARHAAGPPPAAPVAGLLSGRAAARTPHVPRARPADGAPVVA
ncbi:terpene synthase family protein [Streptomyces radicis]|uniref:Terpene synthase n=1 Tax=Streptomyces radicis TaxID=1750517 RepID=A0A3A9WWI4_9ACTN|nr:hypothetical protein [Streptomyces radicis]RKN12166.1 hypothetical protein D7319_04640 [Streptomyces radicis]RKN25781.1 hypothetical protein D7318_05840 [Streptomyces radicis]